MDEIAMRVEFWSGVGPAVRRAALQRFGSEPVANAVTERVHDIVMRSVPMHFSYSSNADLNDKIQTILGHMVSEIVDLACEAEMLGRRGATGEAS